MKNYLQDFFKTFAYETRDSEELLAAYDKIISHKDANTVWDELMDTYKNDLHCDVGGTLRKKALDLAPALALHPYTLDLLLHICLSRQTKEYYKERGLSLDIWQDSMSDLKYKLVECREVYGICGTFVGSWFNRFFDLTRFALGRLQYELIRFEGDYQKNGITLTPDSLVINVHIPRTGTRMSEQDCDASFALAAKHFEKELGGAPIVFRCHSWLLFPKHQTILPPNSNIRKFAARFECLKSGEYADYQELWRLFDRNYPGTPDKLPYATTLHRAYVDLIRAGEKTGWGMGIFLYQK